MFRYLVTLFALWLGASLAPADTSSDCDRASDPGLRIRSCTSIISQDPSAAHAFRNRGQAYHTKGDYSRAVRDYTKAINLDPRDASSYGLRGWAFALKGDNDQAVADLSRAIELNPRSRACL